MSLVKERLEGGGFVEHGEWALSGEIRKRAKGCSESALKDLVGRVSKNRKVESDGSD